MPYLLLALMLTLSVNAAQITFSSTLKPNVLLELYTSEGCSSCPPADRWLGQLKNKPELWQRIVPLAFHVDYWDSLGWRDPYAKSQFSKRQRTHRRFGNFSNVYTPGVLKNGREFRNWYYGFVLDEQAKDVGKLSAVLKDGQLVVRFHNLAQQQALVLNVALLGVGITSKVAAGENSGKTLVHNFVVLNHQTYPQSQKNKQFNWQVSLPKSDVKAERYAIAIWVAQPNYRPIQASGAWL